MKLREGATTIPIEQVQARRRDTRKADPEHVLKLAKDIAQHGLLQPLVVDREGRLVAGLHRLLALKLLLAAPSARSSVWSTLGFDVAWPEGALPEPTPPEFRGGEVAVTVKGVSDAAAFELEVAENEFRRDYGPEEIRALIERLRERGFVEKNGRLARGERSLKQELARILGKSLRTAERLLAEMRGPSDVGRPRLSEDGMRRNLVLSIDGELDRRVRLLAEEKGVTLSELCRELLESALRSKTK